MKDDGNDFHNAGQGMGMTKMVDGKIVRRHAIKGDTIARIDMLVSMDLRRKQYLVEQDWDNLSKLADEYQAHGMAGMSAEIRKEIPS